MPSVAPRFIKCTRNPRWAQSKNRVKNGRLGEYCHPVVDTLGLNGQRPGGTETRVMQWYYAEAGNRIGPIEETELNRLVTLGTVRADTLVWHEGLASWQPLGLVRGMPPAAVHAAARHYAGFWIRFVARL